jgi:hypothetical protein
MKGIIERLRSQSELKSTPPGVHGANAPTISSQAEQTSSSHFPTQTSIADLLDRSAAWADRQEREAPTLIPSLAHSQHPRVMWIGCSDSRIPETTVLDLLPGDLYVHRNLANIVSTDDMSLLADVQYAVEVLGVNHIVICGILAF